MKCEECRGRGYYQFPTRNEPCEYCEGTGQQLDDTVKTEPPKDPEVGPEYDDATFFVPYDDDGGHFVVGAQVGLELPGVLDLMFGNLSDEAYELLFGDRKVDPYDV